MNTAVSVQLHVPDEPIAGRKRWLAAVYDGAELDEVLAGDDGLVTWLWVRWRVLERAGLDRATFGTHVLGYRRELWLWLAGQRTWVQCCSGLIGRLARRVPG
jgi:hypothetical protein